MMIPHFSLNFGPWYEGGHGVDDQDVDGATANQDFGDVQALFPGVRL